MTEPRHAHPRLRRLRACHPFSRSPGAVERRNGSSWNRCRAVRSSASCRLGRSSATLRDPPWEPATPDKPGRRPRVELGSARAWLDARTCVNEHRCVEAHAPPRGDLWRGVRAAEGAGFENRCAGYTVPGVRIPPSPVVGESARCVLSHDSSAGFMVHACATVVSRGMVPHPSIQTKDGGRTPPSLIAQVRLIPCPCLYGTRHPRRSLTVAVQINLGPTAPACRVGIRGSATCRCDPGLHRRGCGPLPCRLLWTGRRW